MSLPGRTSAGEFGKSGYSNRQIAAMLFDDRWQQILKGVCDRGPHPRRVPGLHRRPVDRVRLPTGEVLLERGPVEIAI